MRKRDQKKEETNQQTENLKLFWKPETDPKYKEMDPKKRGNRTSNWDFTTFSWKSETDPKNEESDPKKEEINQQTEN